MCLAQGHNSVTPVLEPAAPQSLVKNSTTEPLLPNSKRIFISILLYIYVFMINGLKFCTFIACQKGLDKQRIPRSDSLFAILTSIL